MKEDIVLYRVDIIDVADTARQIFGEKGAAIIYGKPLPEYDYRFHVTFVDGAETTFGRNTTAEDIVASFKREDQSPI